MKFELYRDSKTEWRWRLIASNNKDVIADSAEGYKAKADAVNGINLVKQTTTSTPVWEHQSDGTWKQY